MSLEKNLNILFADENYNTVNLKAEIENNTKKSFSFHRKGMNASNKDKFNQ